MNEYGVIILSPFALVALGALIMSFLLVKRAGKSETKTSDHERRLNDLESRFAVLQNTLAHMPDKTDHNTVVVLIERLNGELTSTRDGQRALRSSVDRIEGFLLGRNIERDQEK